MCILIVKKAGSVIKEEALENGFNNNPDGWGFSYVDQSRGVIEVKKGLSSFKTFLKHYRKAEQENPESNFLIHFRIATSGGIKEVNCHPFVLNENIVYAHNGILSNVLKADLEGDENDTRAFGRIILKPLYEINNRFYENPTFNRLILSFIESRNKVAILDIENNVKIYNETHGDWVEGVWYSNTSWKYNKKAWGKSTPVSSPFSYAKARQYDSKFYDNAACKVDNGILLLEDKIVKADVSKIVKMREITLTKVTRLFKVNTSKERVDNEIKFWDDETESWYSRDEVDDLILIKYLSGKECFCPTCNEMRGEEEILMEANSISKCAFCKTITHLIVDDVAVNG
ncbi:MAG: class II glutamine amidotransferase [Bacilli bacterium]